MYQGLDLTVYSCPYNRDDIKNSWLKGYFVLLLKSYALWSWVQSLVHFEAWKLPCVIHAIIIYLWVGFETNAASHSVVTISESFIICKLISIACVFTQEAVDIELTLHEFTGHKRCVIHSLVG